MPLFDLRNRPLILAQSAVAVTHTGNTNETTLATVTIPAGAMGLNGHVRIVTLWNYTNSANNKIWRVKFGGTLYQGRTETTTATYRAECQIANRNSASSQVGMATNFAGIGSSTGSIVTTSIDTTAAVDIIFTGQLGSSGESVALEYYMVELFRA